LEAESFRVLSTITSVTVCIGLRPGSSQPSGRNGSDDPTPNPREIYQVWFEQNLVTSSEAPRTQDITLG
jgi:hypothetical protein